VARYLGRGLSSVVQTGSFCRFHFLPDDGHFAVGDLHS